MEEEKRNVRKEDGRMEGWKEETSKPEKEVINNNGRK